MSSAGSLRQLPGFTLFWPSLCGECRPVSIRHRCPVLACWLAAACALPAALLLAAVQGLLFSIWRPWRDVLIVFPISGLQQHEEYKHSGVPQSLAGVVLLALFGQEAGPQEGAQRAYSLLYSCQCHQQASPTVRLFWKVGLDLTQLCL
jgi:hypothetical protein